MKYLMQLILLSSAFVGALPVCAKAVNASAKSEVNDPAFRNFVRNYAHCVSNKRGDIASEFILSNTPSSAILTFGRYSSLRNGDCIADSDAVFSGIGFPADSLRYALADALVNKHFAVEGAASFEGRLPLAHLAFPDPVAHEADLAKARYNWQRDKLESSYKVENSIAFLSRFGECVVRRHPEKSRLWILSPPGTPEEMGRISDLSPDFAPCLPAEAGKMHFSRMMMRGTVALNYYRLAMAAPQPIAGKPN